MKKGSDIQTSFVSGGGEMGRRISDFKWENTSLGAIGTWSQSLKTSVSILLNSTQPMWIGWGKENIFLYNDSYIQVLGQAKHPWALGLPAHIVWSEIWDFCGPLSDKVFKEGKASYVNDSHFFMNRGEFLEEVFYSFSYSAIYDETGAVGGLFCPNVETTPKMLTERRLRTLSELSARALVEKTIGSAMEKAADTIGKNPEDIPFAAIYVTDASGQQARLYTSAGLTVAGTAFPHMLSLHDDGALSGKERLLADVIRTGRATVIDVQDMTTLPIGLANQKIKQAILLPLTSSAMTPPIGAIIAGVNPTRHLDEEYRTFFDLVAGQVSTAYQNAVGVESERKRAEMLAEINAAKTTFFSNISHEFRTPLTLMLGPLEELLRQPDDAFSGQERQNIEIAHRNAMRLLKLVNSLLDFNRIESGQSPLHFERTDLSAFTNELAATFRSIIEQAGLQYHVTCLTFDQPVYVDKEMWEKIVLNLLSNAFKYTLHGSVSLRLGPQGMNAVLTVEDTGVGIPEKALPHMFERFHRVKNTAGRSYEGSGIGLSLVSELVHLHDGAIKVESEEGKGSAFTISIPLGSQHLPAEKILDYPAGFRADLSKVFISEVSTLVNRPGNNKGQTEEAPPQEGAARAHILVVDDNADMLAYISRLLGEHYRVSTATNGKEALDSFTAHPPELVVSDIMMPVMDGTRLLAAIKGNPATRSIPVILLSARAGEESRIEGYDIGADDYLVKPFSAKELLARIRAQFKARKFIEENEQRLETLVEERTRDLVETNRQLESFNYIASHDLQEPLRKIQTFTELMERNLQDEERAAGYLGKIKASAQRMSELIRSVLTYSKLSSSEVLFTSTDLNIVLENIKVDFEVLIQEKRAKIESDMLPIIMAIPLQMNQLFANLISNALKFSREDPVIRIRSEIAGDKVKLTFSDNGIGFEPQYGEKIFQLFQRLHGKHEYTGTGVGLSICKKIVEQHNGTITAVAEPGKGATFIIQLPLVPSHRSLGLSNPETAPYH